MTPETSTHVRSMQKGLLEQGAALHGLLVGKEGSGQRQIMSSLMLMASLMVSLKIAKR